MEPRKVGRPRKKGGIAKKKIVIDKITKLPRGKGRPPKRRFNTKALLKTCETEAIKNLTNNTMNSSSKPTKRQLEQSEASSHQPRPKKVKCETNTEQLPRKVTRSETNKAKVKTVEISKYVPIREQIAEQKRLSELQSMPVLFDAADIGTTMESNTKITNSQTPRLKPQKTNSPCKKKIATKDANSNNVSSKEKIETTITTETNLDKPVTRKSPVKIKISNRNNKRIAPASLNKMAKKDPTETDSPEIPVASTSTEMIKSKKLPKMVEKDPTKSNVEQNESFPLPVKSEEQQCYKKIERKLKKIKKEEFATKNAKKESGTLNELEQEYLRNIKEKKGTSGRKYKLELIYIAEGLREDCDSLVKKCLQVYKLNFEKFCEIWKEMNFSAVFHGRPSVAELAELSEEAILVAKFYMVTRTMNFENNVAGLFLVYAFLNLQPYKDFAALRLVPEDVPAIKYIEEEARKQKRNDVIYILGSVLIRGPCHFHVLEREAALEASIRKYYDGSVQTRHPRGILTNSCELECIFKELLTFEQKYKDVKQLLSERFPDGGLTVSKQIGASLQEEFQSMLSTIDVHQEKEDSKEGIQLIPEDNRNDLVRSLKERAMSNVVDPMRHLTSCQDGQKSPHSSPQSSPAQGSPEITKSKNKGKGKGKGRCSATNIQELIEERSDKSKATMPKPIKKHIPPPPLQTSIVVPQNDPTKEKVIKIIHPHTIFEPTYCNTDNNFMKQRKNLKDTVKEKDSSKTHSKKQKKRSRIDENRQKNDSEYLLDKYPKKTEGNCADYYRDLFKNNDWDDLAYGFDNTEQLLDKADAEELDIQLTSNSVEVQPIDNINVEVIDNYSGNTQKYANIKTYVKPANPANIKNKITNIDCNKVSNVVIAPTSNYLKTLKNVNSVKTLKNIKCIKICKMIPNVHSFGQIPKNPIVSNIQYPIKVSNTRSWKEVPSMKPHKAVSSINVSDLGSSIIQQNSDISIHLPERANLNSLEVSSLKSLAVSSINLPGKVTSIISKEDSFHSSKEIPNLISDAEHNLYGEVSNINTSEISSIYTSTSTNEVSGIHTLNNISATRSPMVSNIHLPEEESQFNSTNENESIDIYKDKLILKNNVESNNPPENVSSINTSEQVSRLISTKEIPSTVSAQELSSINSQKDILNIKTPIDVSSINTYKKQSNVVESTSINTNKAISSITSEDLVCIIDSPKTSSKIVDSITNVSKSNRIESTIDNSEDVPNLIELTKKSLDAVDSVQQVSIIEHRQDIDPSASISEEVPSIVLEREPIFKSPKRVTNIKSPEQSSSIKSPKQGTKTKSPKGASSIKFPKSRVSGSTRTPRNNSPKQAINTSTLLGNIESPENSITKLSTKPSATDDAPNLKTLRLMKEKLKRRERRDLKNTRIKTAFQRLGLSDIANFKKDT